MTSSDKVTNLDYLNDLAKGDTGFIQEMIQIFLTENPEEIKNLEQAIEEINYNAIKSISHHMKSTIPFVGLDKLIGKDLLDIEKLAGEQIGIEKIKILFAEVKTTCNRAFEELKT
ncbi:MAG: Hpt domain-containing protein [Bacteroidetes bacterium]|nr:Hpt domain-containing protein [Bacteroidota bacterium]